MSPHLTAQDVAALRCQLWDAGFRPVALKTGDKMPLIREWPDRARRDPPADADSPARPDMLNTGILCDGLRVVDIDVDDKQRAGAIEALALEKLGSDAPIRWRNNSPRVALLYRAAHGEPRKLSRNGEFGKVEILGHGNQVFAFGTHPSGAALQWHPEPPGIITRSALPAVSEEQISTFLDAAGALIGAQPATPPPGADDGHASSRHGPSADIGDVVAALHAIPNNGPPDWEHWNKIGLAVFAATGGSLPGKAAWLAWSEKHPNHNPAACEERWAHYDRHADREPKIGAGTLFHLAAQAQPGWRRPSEQNPDAGPLEWGIPDMTVLRLGRRAPPALPQDVFGPEWAGWIVSAAEAAAAPPDYVGLPLLAGASALIGHARWPQATPGWIEPPHIWAASVGDSGSAKSPGADSLLRDVLPIIEQRMLGDFPEKLREWKVTAEIHGAAQEQWKADVRTAQNKKLAPPLPPAENLSPEPQAPRLRQSDVTVEKVATLLATAAPKGLLIVRDELAGWLLGLSAYNDAGRAFWIEAYGGRPYRVERQKTPEPIIVPRLAVAVTGTTQPERLAQMFRDSDDGLLGRFVWGWPDPLPVFRLSQTSPASEWAIEALDRLRLLDLGPGSEPNDPPRPIMVPLSPTAVAMMEEFGQDMQRRQQEAGGLLRSAFGKARGLALRLSLVLEMLLWCGRNGMEPPPAQIGDRAFGNACDLVADYFMPMAERVFGDAAATQAERNAATLARWIIRERAKEVHVRTLQRNVRLPGLNTAGLIHAAAEVLTEADWLAAAGRGKEAGRPRAAYTVNPAVLEPAA